MWAILYLNKTKIKTMYSELAQEINIFRLSLKTPFNAQDLINLISKSKNRCPYANTIAYDIIDKYAEKSFGWTYNFLDKPIHKDFIKNRVDVLKAEVKATNQKRYKSKVKELIPLSQITPQQFEDTVPRDSISAYSDKELIESLKKRGYEVTCKICYPVLVNNKFTDKEIAEVLRDRGYDVVACKMTEL